jgi:hypothetical protein
MSAHTPGPWELRRSTRHNYWFIDYPQQEGSVTLTKLDCGESDARLIAATPELLQVLKSLMDTRGSHFINNEVDGMHGWDEAALAAISKATGESR